MATLTIQDDVQIPASSGPTTLLAMFTPITPAATSMCVRVVRQGPVECSESPSMQLLVPS
jgi:hypothetical protein